MGHLAGALGLPSDREGEFNLTCTLQKVAGLHAFGEAGVKPSDIDVAQIYDSFTITALLQFEDTHGGLLSFAHPGMPGGIFHIIEGVRQRRHECGPRQVEDTQLGLVTNVSAMASNHSDYILGRD